MAIGLVAVLAIATMTYVQDVMRRAGPATTATVVISQASQIAAARRVYSATHGAGTLSVQNLVDAKLLRTVPVPPFKDGGQYTFTSSSAVRLSVTSEDLCSEIQKKLFNTSVIPNVRPDNHGCYNSDGAYVFVMQG
jgi:hypothetical protein